MPSITFKINRYLLVFGLLFCLKTAMAQEKYTRIGFRIDSLANIGLPKSALKEVDKLDELARKDKNAPQQIRAVVYRMTFQSYLQEDALTAIISRLKNDIGQADYPVKPVLQSLLAQMFWNYYKENRDEFGQRTRLAKPDSDFTKWDLQTIIDETTRLYNSSLNEASTEQNTPIGTLDGVLTGDSTTRYLRPTLYDLLVQRAFDFFLSDEAAINKPRLPFSLNDARFFGDSQTFARLTINTSDTLSVEYKGIKYLQQATAFHLRHNDQEAIADLDLQRLKFLYSRSHVKQKDSLYLRTLKYIAEHFSAKPISSEALLLEGQYYQGIDSLAIAHKLFREAVTAYPKSLGGKNANSLAKEIEEKELAATVDNFNTPGKPILALLNYTNIENATVNIYHLSNEQVNALVEKDQWDEGNDISESAELNKYLKSPVQTQQLRLPNTGDYKAHSAEFKIDALPVGTYIIQVEGAGVKSKALTSLTSFKVSRLSYSARVKPSGETEFAVMDRETGVPVKDVKIDVHQWQRGKNNKYARLTAGTGFSDSNGKCVLKFIDDNYFVTLTKGDDTFTDRHRRFYGYREPDNSSAPQLHTILFTDRQLYRPGQTIYFKGLQTSVTVGKTTIVPNTYIVINFKDINQKTISSLDLQTNEFGTVQGSFIIPQTIANGEVYLNAANGDVGVRVEEYKRPTFQVTFEPVTETYRLADSVKLKGKVTAFSGYGISAARVAIHITGNELTKPDDDDDNSDVNVETLGKPQEIKTDTLLTNASGEFTVGFVAGDDAKQAKGMALNYNISAEVTDASGETQSANTTVNVSDNPITIDAAIPEKLLFNTDTKIPLSVSNINGQQQRASATMKIYALKGPGKVFKTREWSGPDRFLWSKNEFETLFPGYAWKNEDNYVYWPQTAMVAEMKIDAADSSKSLLDLSLLNNQPGGIYKVVITAKDVKGDTTSLTRYVDVIKTGSPPQKMDDWITPVVTNVSNKQDAEFLLGINKPATVLMETYDGTKQLSAEWLTLSDGGYSKISVPVNATSKSSFGVQFMMVNDNRLYTLYQKITVVDTVKKLNIRFLTFRDKLQPGEKEQWKLQLSAPGNDKPSAELLAAMYDASLDDIAPAQYWETNFDDNPYSPDYFQWVNNDFVKGNETSSFEPNPNDYPLIERIYESLDLFNYNYYGGENFGYQDYLQQTDDKKSAAKSDKKLLALYLKNAALVKSGFDVSGRVIAADGGDGLAGVNITIKDQGISTQSNSQGYFRIKVPAGSLLVFKQRGYVTKILKTKPGNGQIIVLAEKGANDHGQKYSKIDKNVGLSANAVVREVKFPPPVLKADMESKSVNRAYKMNLALPDRASGYMVAEYNMAKADTVRKGGVTNQARSQPIIPRTNFNETAFFYPQLHTDEKGQILIDFTIPEALTRWKFRGFAHTKELQTGYIEQTIVTQKQLSISVNTPRFLREGDTITISARLANLTAGKLKGKVQMQLFNALNMRPVSLLINNDDSSQSFEIDGGTNKAVSFRMVIPAGLDALDYKLTADAGEFTDGEENTLPVLPNRTLVTESMPMMVRAGQTRSFTFNKLVNQSSSTLKNKTLTLEYTQNPAWYAVQALPYMMEFPYECSEQVFSRYFANSLATNIVNKTPAIKQVFDQWKSANSGELLSNLEKNQELKATLLEETPWLKDAVSESEQKKRIALLFDLNKMSDELKLNLEKLQKRQLPNGGFTWFGGSVADRYITGDIVQGIGELNHLGIRKDDPTLTQIAGNALSYLDNQLVADEKKRKKAKQPELEYGDLEIYAWFTRSYFLSTPMNAALKPAFANYIKWAAEEWTMRNVYEQAMIALTMQRYGKPTVTAAIERSLLETAQQSDDLGMYWAKNQQGYYWYESPIETQSLLIELFTEAGNNAKAVDEMKIWLLRNKQTNDWKTTKATAAACYALLMKGKDLLADTARSEIKLDGKPLEVLKPDVKADAGAGYIKTSWTDEQIKPAFGKVEIKNNGKNISWGALHWQYLENLDKITSSQTNITLERKYFIQKQTDAGAVLTAIDATNQPKTGDLLKVVVYLKADRDFEYVQLKDMRPAGTEPVEALSAYKYQDGLFYYQVTKDVATNFFISYLNKGNYVFEYQLRVAQPGNFSTGITSIQCMYAPEFNAHSEGSRMSIKP